MLAPTAGANAAHPTFRITSYPLATTSVTLVTSFHTCTTTSFGSAVPKWSYTSDHCTGRRPCAMAIAAVDLTNRAYPPSGVSPCSASHALMRGVLLQHAVSTSSPPRWIIFSGKRPDGARGADGLPPVHSSSSLRISSNVPLRETSSGVVHVFEGQSSG